jgi:hypothetical protein
MRPRLLPLVPLLIIAACTAKASHPLAGNWTQHTGTDAKGATLTIDPTGTKVHAHPAPRADGSTDHFDGTCSFDAATKAVTVKCKLMGDGKSDTWAGKLDGEKLELASADGKLTFEHGGDSHGH